MNSNISALIKACDKTGCEYKIHHSGKRLIEVFIEKRSHLFVNTATPLNSHSVSNFCIDKDYFYTFLQDVINMPRTQSFINPNWKPQYAPPEREKNLQEILDAIEAAFPYPAIVKKNSGATGDSVFKVSDRAEAKAALQTIFDVNNKSYDKIALAQEYLHLKKEYRVVYLNGSLSFAYEKNIDEAVFQGNLSPLHWAGAKAILIEDNTLLAQIHKFCEPMFQKMMIPFCGLDVALDENDNWWLIEANSAPGFSKIVAHGGEHKVIAMYEQMLAFLSN